MKFIKSPFKLIVVLVSIKNREDYEIFKQIARNKHFYDWQWRVLDKIYKI